MSTEQIEETDVYVFPKEIPYRDRVITPSDFLRMLVGLIIFEERLFRKNVKPKREINYYKNRETDKILYEEVCALFRAYGLFEELHPHRPVHSFINGEFISNRKYEYDLKRPDEFRECWDFLGKDHTFFKWLPFNKQYHFNTDIKRFFSIMMRYKLSLDLATMYSGLSIFRIADGSREAISLMQQLKQRFIGPAIEKMDKTLIWFFQNESVKPYAIGELIDQYGYPDITDKEPDSDSTDE